MNVIILFFNPTRHLLRTALIFIKIYNMAVADQEITGTKKVAL